MADKTLYVLRKKVGKQMAAFSFDPFPSIPTDEEQVQVSVDDTDTEHFNRKFSFNSSSGELEFNEKFWFYPRITNDAVAFNPITGFPQINSGGNYITFTIQKRDKGEVDQVDSGDNNRIYILSEGKDSYAANGSGTPITFLDLANGTMSFRIYSGVQKGITSFKLASEKMELSSFFVESV